MELPRPDLGLMVLSLDHGVSLGCCGRTLALEPSVARSRGAPERGVCVTPALFVLLICLTCLALTGAELAALVLKACSFRGLECIFLTLPAVQMPPSRSALT